MGYSKGDSLWTWQRLGICVNKYTRKREERKLLLVLVKLAGNTKEMITFWLEDYRGLTFENYTIVNNDNLLWNTIMSTEVVWEQLTVSKLSALSDIFLYLSFCPSFIGLKKKSNIFWLGACARSNTVAKCWSLDTTTVLFWKRTNKIIAHKKSDWRGDSESRPTLSNIASPQIWFEARRALGAAYLPPPWIHSTLPPTASARCRFSYPRLLPFDSARETISSYPVRACCSCYTLSAFVACFLHWNWNRVNWNLTLERRSLFFLGLRSTHWAFISPRW